MAPKGHVVAPKNGRKPPFFENGATWGHQNAIIDITRAGECVIGFTWPHVAPLTKNGRKPTFSRVGMWPSWPQSITVNTTKGDPAIYLQATRLAAQDAAPLQCRLKVLGVAGVVTGFAGILAP